ncbi:MAG: TatD family hydrolase [Planctomycetota bacterium]|nr:TatD family hydrolase [Planctomycetota bacterium]
MIDTHCHLTYAPIAEQFGAVMERARAAGVDRMISIGTAPPDAEKAASLAALFPGIYSTVGLHPHYAADWRDQTAFAEAVRRIAALPKVVALGEMGMDRHYPDPPLADQQRVFEWQLALAAELNKPAVIHNREATDLVIPIIRASGINPARFVFHCFTGSDAELDAILELGACVSFTGVVTFKTSADLLARSNRVPIGRVMIETDAPYLTPAPFRKVKVNEPGYVVYVAKAMATSRGMSEADFVAQVDANAERFFGIPAKGA